ncbi:hypothetical protein [Streptomyces hoynatensis]|uniref:hypothetical protein n=1 Tax=Streptomyces hoynatensis TaxID=1141874 RepID=UPI00131A1BC7|nr:hypothetical protein [Streptomyces hoynatensis]
MTADELTRAAPGDEPGPGTAPPPPALELLVHGVGGHTPQEMLEDPRTTRVTGDATASVHRRTADLADRPWDEAEPLREAYCWSGLTSGNGARALWLLLLPFMIVNLAHWMRPAARGTRRLRFAYDLLVRITALSLTVLLTAGACVVVLDLVAWQCAGSAECARHVSWLGPFSGEGWWAQPGRRLALGSAVPLALVLLLWWLSHRTWSAYESASPPARPRLDAERHPPLALPGFWYGRALVARLRATHTTAGLLTLAAVLLAATGPYDRGPHGRAALAAAGWALAALTAAGWAAVAVRLVRHGRTEDEPDLSPEPPLSSALPWGAALLVLAVAVHTAWSRPDWDASGRLPLATTSFPALVVAQCALSLGIAVAAHRLHRSTPRTQRGALAGLGGAAVALLACGLGVLLTGGVAQRAGDWLDPTADPGEPGAEIPGPPQLLSWAAATVPALLLVLLVLALAAVVRVSRRTGRLRPGVRARYPGEDGEPVPERSREIASAIARAELTDAAPVLVGWLSGASLVLALGALAGSLTGDPPSEAAASAPAFVSGCAELSEALGSWLMGAGVVLLVAMGRRAYRDAGTRRTVGILWDVGTFWPRAAHPFAPPCYAERAVPDLSWRVSTWVETTGGRVVLSGHSQGSVLAAAAVWQLDAATRGRVALLTYGSPLERLYGRWFPLFFGRATLRSLHQDAPCWRNLWRETDPIGGPVGVRGTAAPPVDAGPLADPLHYGRTPSRPLPEPILGHGDYPADPAFAAERAELYRALLRAPAPAATEARVVIPPPGHGGP